jgi:hypothetical protein
MRYSILKVYHNNDYDVLEILDKKTGKRNNYAFPIQKTDIIIPLKVKK